LKAERNEIQSFNLLTPIDKAIEPSPLRAAGNVPPLTAVLRSTVKMKIHFQFAR
jgi:hypothetical protein